MITTPKELAKRFETKYGIKIEPYRATSTDIMTKVRAEAQAKHGIGTSCRRADMCFFACAQPSAQNNRAAIAAIEYQNTLFIFASDCLRLTVTFTP